DRLADHAGSVGGGSPSSRAAHGSATSAWRRWNSRTVGAPLGGGRPARAEKNPATAAAIPPASGRTSHGSGPPSSRRLGSQKATSKRPLPTHAWFQSTRTTRASTKQRLSLRTS